MASFLWIGDTELPEFAVAAAVLRNRGHLTVAGVETALRCDVGADMAAVFLAEALPSEHGAEAIDGLRRRRPNVPIVRLVGPGCDGELRSRPPSLVHRHRWLEAPSALEHDCDLLERGACPSWGRPVTLGPEERLGEDPDDSPYRLAPETRVAVQAHDAATAAWLIDLVQAAGAQVIRLDTACAMPDADVVLWQVPDDHRTADVELRWRQQARPAEVVALVAFPRVEQVARMRAAGANCVVALPALPGAIERAVAAAAGSNRST